MSLIPFEQADLNFDGTDSVLQLLQDIHVAKRVDDLEASYYTINIHKTLGQLLEVGQLLQVAYAASHGFPSATYTIEILCDYNSMVVDSFTVTGLFERLCLKALDNHRLAYKKAQKNDLKKALNCILKCATVAGEMAKKAEELENLSIVLISKSNAALKAAVNDTVHTQEEKTRKLEAIAAEEAKIARRKVEAEELAKQVSDAREDERQALARKEKENERQFALAIVNAVVAPVSMVGAAYLVGGRPQAPAGGDANQAANNDGKLTLGERLILDEAEARREERKAEKEASPKGKEASSEGKEARSEGRRSNVLSEEALYTQARMNLENELRKTKAELQESLTLLSSINVQKDALNSAVQSLDVATKTLGEITVIFNNCKLFWKGVQYQCEALKDIAELEDAADPKDSDKDEFLEQLQSLALKWLSLCSISIKAHREMEKINSEMGNILSHLPSHDQAQGLVEKAIRNLLLKLEC